MSARAKPIGGITISPELVRALKRLCLGKILDTLPTRLALAEDQGLATQDVLLMILTDEIGRRDSSAAMRRAAQAGLDPDMVLERWDTSAKVHFDRRVLAELATLRFLASHHNVVILGPVGVGKTFLANALGHLACRGGLRSECTDRTRCFESSSRVGWTTRATL